MEQKTKIEAKPGHQEILITRDFELPVHLLFKAYEEAELVEAWMGTKVLKLESKRHGGYQYETTDPMGNKHLFSGVIHEFLQDERIVRTFEMEDKQLGIQLEFLAFEALSADRSRLVMHVVYQSVAIRDQILKLPFAQGINMAHNRIEDLLKQQNN
ncbi:SRPBCC domain-containing protein [Pedobacter aquatilis]|uniref:SRPBCC domain-containing protein n=1 Tax=Pedobacter aquatilis TaxID=351343 RepID=UPI00292D78D7|nr:SRPBCC domain-containing protein [Pedobacter aquatilis]